MTSLGDSVASDGEVSSCRYSVRGSVSRFLAARRRESIDSGLVDSAAANHIDFRRASDPVLNSCGVAETPLTQRCHSSASAPGTAATTVWRGHRVGGGSVAGSRGGPASLMSSHSSIATNMSEDVCEVKFTRPPPPSSEPLVVDQDDEGLIIPDEMRDFINKTYGNQPAAAAAMSLNADSTVADSPAAPVESTSGFDDPAAKLADTKPSTLTSCMYEGQAGGNSTSQNLRNFTQPQHFVRAINTAVGDVHNTMVTLPASDVVPQSFAIPVTRPSAAYFRSSGVTNAYQNSVDEVQVSQVSQSWRPEPATTPRTFGAGTLDLSADDLAVRHRRNPHQMNWWTRMYGYHSGGTAGNYHRPNYALPLTSTQPPRTAASFVSSHMSPGCNQVLDSLNSSHSTLLTCRCGLALTSL